MLDDAKERERAINAVKVRSSTSSNSTNLFKGIYASFQTAWSRANRENDIDAFLLRQNSSDKADYQAKKIEAYLSKGSLSTWFPKQWMSTF